MANGWLEVEEQQFFYNGICRNFLTLPHIRNAFCSFL